MEYSQVSPVLVSSPKNEILVVQVKVGHLNVRIINCYGPQEDDPTNNIHDFWLNVEKEIIDAKNENCCVLIQCDANAKLGNVNIKNNPNEMSNNGQILLDILSRHNLMVLNSDVMCKGTITRHKNSEV